MEKIIGCFALGALIVFSSHAFTLEEVLVTGTQRSVDLGNPNYNNQPAAPSYNGVGVLPPEYKQGMASQDQSKARSMEEVRKYCSANKSSINFNYELCVNREMNIYADNALKCPPETNVTTEVNPVVGSISASTSPNATCITALRIDYDRKVSNCSRDTGHMMCKAYGGF